MADEMVSVIIPAYNSAATIEDAVRSALSQSADVEVIVVDDCSADNTQEVLDRYRNVPGVRLVRNERNMGAAASRNRGVELASGRYVAFLDADDIWLDGKLEKQLALMKKTGAVLCSTARELMNERGERTGRVIGVPERITYRSLLRGNVINCSSVVMRRETALEFPMGDDDIHEDYVCWLRVLRRYDSAVAVNEPLILYRSSAKGKSGSKLRSAGMTYRVYRRVGLGVAESCLCFVCYAVNGVIKYFIK